jgi:hypothetical protein
MLGLIGISNPVLYVKNQSFIGQFCFPIDLGILWSKMSYFESILQSELLHIILSKN